jgi:tRNA(Ile)-lysidine synthetase-like protein
MHPAIRARAITSFLEKNGLREPSARQIAAVESIVFSQKPSASVRFSSGVIVGRSYRTLRVLLDTDMPEEVLLPCPGSVIFGSFRITARPAVEIVNTKERFTVAAAGHIRVRSRQAGDSITFSYGTKSLKKLFIDHKIPASDRPWIPVLCDDQGILGVGGFGADITRTDCNGSLTEIHIAYI